MKLLVTGANGFLGQSVVAAALARGHVVRAMVRNAADAQKRGWDREPNVEVVVADLRKRKGLADAIRGVDCVLHLAATKDGDLYTQLGGTVVPTENLLSAMTEAGVRHIVACSTFSVYDCYRIPSWSTVDESSLTEKSPHTTDQDQYAQTKLIQEQMVLEHAARHGWDWTVIRPGIIFGKDNLWCARLGMEGKRLWIRISAWAKMPLTYVDNCADAFVLAAEKDAARGQIFNVVDDETPTARRFMSLLRQRATPRPMIVPVSWTVIRSIAGMAWLTNKLLLGGQAKLPGLVIPARVHTRFKPLSYSNSKIKQMLGWQPRVPLEEAVARSFGESTGKDVAPAIAVSTPKTEVMGEKRTDLAARQRMSPGSADLLSVGAR